MFTIRNIVIVTLMQVGVIVAGVLASGLCHRFWTMNGMAAPPLATWLLYHYGVLWFAIPAGWSLLALTFQNRPQISDDARSFVFGLGIILLLTLVVFVVLADVAPWMNFLRIGGLDAGE